MVRKVFLPVVATALAFCRPRLSTDEPPGSASTYVRAGRVIPGDGGAPIPKLPPELYRAVLDEAGKRASFLVLPEDPLEDIRRTRNAVDVYRSGERVGRKGGG